MTGMTHTEVLSQVWMLWFSENCRIISHQRPADLQMTRRSVFAGYFSRGLTSLQADVVRYVHGLFHPEEVDTESQGRFMEIVSPELHTD